MTWKYSQSHGDPAESRMRGHQLSAVGTMHISYLMKTTSITGATHSLKPNGSEHTTVCTHDQLHTGQLAGYGLSLWSVVCTSYTTDMARHCAQNTWPKTQLVSEVEVASYFWTVRTCQAESLP